MYHMFSQKVNENGSVIVAFYWITFLQYLPKGIQKLLIDYTI